jgi:hypothetical protein
MLDVFGIHGGVNFFCHVSCNPHAKNRFSSTISALQRASEKALQVTHAKNVAA